MTTTSHLWLDRLRATSVLRLFAVLAVALTALVVTAPPSSAVDIPSARVVVDVNGTTPTGPVVDGSPVTPGEVLDYTITFRSLDGGAAEVRWAASLDDVLDDGEVVPGSLIWDAPLEVALSGPTLFIDGMIGAPGEQPADFVVRFKVRVGASGSGNGSLIPFAFKRAEPPASPCANQFLCTVNTVQTVRLTNTVSGAGANGQIADASVVSSGDLLTYSLIFQNPSDTEPATALRFVDDASDVLDDAALTPHGAPALVSGTGLAVSPVDAATGQFVVTGDLAPGASALISYQVRVNPEATLRNSLLQNFVGKAAGAYTRPAECRQFIPQDPALRLDDPTCTRNTMRGLSITKTVSPADGQQVVPGQVVTYTVKIANTGSDFLPVVNVIDDLSGVLDDADLVREPVNGAGNQRVVIDTPCGDGIRFSGGLQPREHYTWTFDVKVKSTRAPGSDGVLRNFIGSAEGCAYTPPTTCDQALPAQDNPLCTVNPLASATPAPVANPVRGPEVAPAVAALASPRISTKASHAVTEPGTVLHDRVHVEKLATPYRGNATASLYGPYPSRAQADCAPQDEVGSVRFEATNGTVTTPGIKVSAPGYYTWVASLSGDRANRAVTHRCGLASETTLVRKRPLAVAPVISAGFSGDVAGSAKTAALGSLQLPGAGSSAATLSGPIAGGRVLLPGDVDKVAMLSRGAQPGDAVGTTVIAGHVSDRQNRPGALGSLRGVQRGQVVTYRTADGSQHRYRVVAVRSYPRGQVPLSVFSTSGPAKLALITCTGIQWRGTHFHYTRNLVVTAIPVG